jgi:hypothetical protein
MGNALVGRCTKQEKSDKSIWFILRFISIRLLDTWYNLSLRQMFRIFVFSLIVIATNSCSTKPKEKATKNEANQLPILPIKLLTGETIDTQSLLGNTILILFFTDCDHCQQLPKTQSPRSKMLRFHTFNDLSRFLILQDQLLGTIVSNFFFY